MTAFHEPAPADMVWWESPIEKPVRAEAPPRPRTDVPPPLVRRTQPPAPAPAPPAEVWSTRDLSEQRARESRLYHAQRMASLGELASGICHDFNNLLTTIIGNLSEVVRVHELDGDAREMVEDALSAAIDGANLTRRLGIREPTGRPRPVDLAEAVGELGRMLKRVIKRGVRVELSLEDDVSAVVDRAQLESAVMNLVLNAQNAMPEGGLVVMAVERVGPRARIRVSDEGIGMDAETARRATEMFFTTRGEQGGTGIGLAMVKDFVGHHGGQLEIESAPGRGTCVTLWVPWVAEATPRTALPTTR
ncbi:MAG: ATP-binding protein [Myxococcota bacterium]